jgi:SAM-dependent methyltransferase
MTTTAFDPVRYKETTREQWQQAAEAWHRWGPTLHSWLDPVTQLMLDLARVEPGGHVLDVATGAGEPALSIAERVGASGSVLATDISSNLLEFAQRSASERGLSNLETRVMDGEHLDLPDESFDVVTSRLGLVYFPNQQQALTEMRRVLKPGGRVAAIVYTTPQNNPFFSIPVSIIRQRAQLPPPLPGQPGPFSLHSASLLEQAYQAAGFRDVHTRVVAAPLRMASAAECVRFERESFGALHQMLAGLTEVDRQAVWADIERALGQFEGPGGFEGPCELIVAVGVR